MTKGQFFQLCRKNGYDCSYSGREGKFHLKFHQSYPITANETEKEKFRRCIQEEDYKKVS